MPRRPAWTRPCGAGHHADVLAEAAARVAEQPLRERRWELLALAQYRSGQQAEALRTLRQARHRLAEELGLDPGPALTALEEAVLRQDPSLGAVPSSPEPSATCPYRGLVPYDASDAETYFGRDGELADCLRRLADAGVLVVVGPSGSGKSSLVRAGVAAALERGGTPVVVITPGRTRWPHSPRPTGPPVAGPGRRSVRGGDHAVRRWGRAHPLLRRPRRAARSRWWWRCVPTDWAGSRRTRRSPGSSNVACTCSRRWTRLASGRPSKGRPGGLACWSSRVWWSCWSARPRGEPGALPLLSHALAETWAHREGRTLTVAGYHASGGIHGAVAKSAELVYERAAA